MGALFFILPILALDTWLCATTGRRQVGRWWDAGKYPAIGAALVVGLGLAVWLGFFVHYGAEMERRQGFPIPTLFYHADESLWRRAAVPAPVYYIGIAADIFTGLAAPFIPFKVAEFLRQVKAELK